MNEVIFTIQKCIDCPKSLFWKLGQHNDMYACMARSKFSGNCNIDIIPDYTKIPNWCPLLDQKNYIKKATGELV